MSVLPLSEIVKMLIGGAVGSARGGSERAFTYTVEGVCIVFNFSLFSDCRLEKQAVCTNYVTNYNNSRQTISTSVNTFRKYVVTTRVFDQQDWSNTFNCWVSRPGSAARSRTMFREGEYVKSDAAPLRRLS